LTARASCDSVTLSFSKIPALFLIKKKPESHTHSDGKGKHMNAVMQSISLMEPAQREKMTLGKIRFGIIGTNGAAKAHRIPALANDPRVTIASVATGDLSQVRPITKKFPAARITTEALDVVKDSYVDAVLITTRPEYHAPLVCAALKAGKHVWVESPLATKPEELQTVVEAAQANPSKQLMVGFNRRFSPLMQRVRKLMPSIQAMHYRISKPVGNDTGNWLGPVTHAIDTLIALAGALPVSVHAASPRAGDVVSLEPEHISITIHFGNGALATILYNAHPIDTMPQERLEVSGAGRTAVIEDWRRLRFYGARAPRGVNSRFNTANGYAEEEKALISGLISGTPAIAAAEYYATLRTLFAVQRALVSGSKESVTDRVAANDTAPKPVVKEETRQSIVSALSGTN
jgi:predicted dehydrogenase